MTYPASGKIAQHLVVLGGVGFFMALLIALSGVRFNLTPSLPIGFYRTKEYTTDAPCPPDALVLLCLPHAMAKVSYERQYLGRGNCPDGIRPIGKWILATMGDTIDLTATGFLRHGTLLMGTQPRVYDHHGQPLEHIAFGRYVVAPHEVWLYTDQPDSWDSRYWGPVSDRNILAVMRPVWTWSPTRQL